MTRPVLAAILAVASVAACGSDDGGGFPIVPGGGGGTGSSSQADAAVDGGGDASMTITGRVCLIDDARSPTTCAATGADGFTVTLGTVEATTAADGMFTLVRPTGTNLVWRVSGTTIRASALKYSSSTSTPLIPAISTLIYDDMLAATQASIANGDGAIITRAARNGTPVANLVVESAPLSTVYYDGATTVDWEQDSTGSNGVAWIPSIPTGTAALTFDTGTATSTASGVPVFADTVTFVFHAVP
jgi:hypothetical protein